MTALLKHTDDDGDLSVFASEEQVLFVCSKGHWWVVDAVSTGSAPKSAVSKARKDAAARESSGAQTSVEVLSERFGRDVLKAMKLD